MKKGFILGFLLCALLMGTVSISAASALNFTLVKTSYKTTIAGKSYNDIKAPILINGTTNYIPLTKPVADALNINATTNTKTKTLQINAETPTQIVYYTENNIEYIEVDGIKYIAIENAIANGYVYDVENQNLNIYMNKNDKYNSNPLFSNVPYYEIKKDIYVDYNYFTNSIQNLTKLETVKGNTKMNEDKFTPDGIKAEFFNGEYYIMVGRPIEKWLEDWKSKLISTKYSIALDVQKDSDDYKTAKLTNRGLSTPLNSPDILLNNIPIFTNIGVSYIKYDFYINKILPLIK